MRTTKIGSFGSSWSLACASLLVVAAVGGFARAAPPTDAFPSFTPMPGVTPEGVAVDRIGQVYVSVRDGDQGWIWRFSATGEGGPFLHLGTASIGGLAFSTHGDLYAAMATGPDQGVYRISRNGNVERLPGSDAIVFANALAFDRRGTLYVTESFSLDPSGAYGDGGLWRILPEGDAELWLRDPLLTGIGAVLGFPGGANGIACYHRDLYVVNTDKGFVVRVPIAVDGSPGQPEVWAVLQEVDGSPLAGSPFPLMGDGLSLDVYGNVYVAVISRAAIVRIDAADGTQSTVAMLAFAPDAPAPLAPLDAPASIAFGTAKGGRDDLFVTNLGWMANLVPGPPWPGPGLVRVPAGAPGLPLP